MRGITWLVWLYAIYLVTVLISSTYASFIRKLNNKQRDDVIETCKYAKVNPQAFSSLNTTPRIAPQRYAQKAANMSQDRVMGGAGVVQGQVPFAAAIITSDGICGAAIISPIHILSARHCFYMQGSANPTDFLVKAGNVCVRESKDEECDEESQMETFTPKLVVFDARLSDITGVPYDIVLVELETEMPIGNSLKYICLSESTGVGLDNMGLYGWGVNSNNEDDPLPARLQLLTSITQLNEAKTLKIIREKYEDVDNIIIYQSTFGMKQPDNKIGEPGRQGDSGGGVFKTVDYTKPPLLIGIYISTFPDTGISIATAIDGISPYLCNALELCVNEESKLKTSLISPNMVMMRLSQALKEDVFANSFDRIDDDESKGIYYQCDGYSGPFTNNGRYLYVAGIIELKSEKIICGLTLTTPQHGITTKKCLIENHVIEGNQISDKFGILIGKVKGQDEMEIEMESQQILEFEHIGMREATLEHSADDILAFVQFHSEKLRDEIAAGCLLQLSSLQPLKCFAYPWVSKSALEWNILVEETNREKMEKNCMKCTEDSLKCYKKHFPNRPQSNAAAYHGSPLVVNDRSFFNGIIVDTVSCPDYVIVLDSMRISDDLCYYFGRCDKIDIDKQHANDNIDYFIVLPMNPVKTVTKV
ncbi:trypsin domain-containing protein [Ditylenchus destructor]|nr:trypsin domain-containing protein [Ditylenchus destructor]